MEPGDAVWYEQPRTRPYGPDRDVPGRVVCVTAERVRVAIRIEDGTTRDLVVSPKNLRVREAS